MNKHIVEEEEEEVLLTWPQMQLMMKMMGHYDKMSNPVDQYRWSNIGLKFCRDKQHTRGGYGWRFSVENKGKFMFAKIKYGF